jgi:hypothetical protein
MKKAMALGLILVLAAVVSGCATAYPVGSLLTELKLPIGATGNAGGSKIGTAECVSYLGMIATGDASIETAKKNGNISKITHVDWEVKNILGLIGKYKVTVYGD